MKRIFLGILIFITPTLAVPANAEDNSPELKRVLNAAQDYRKVSCTGDEVFTVSITVIPKPSGGMRRYAAGMCIRNPYTEKTASLLPAPKEQK